MDSSRSSVSRRWSLIDRIPECFPERAASEKSARSKIAEFPASRSVLGDPEYLTLTKLLSFLHAALILRQQLTTQADLIRFVSTLRWPATLGGLTVLLLLSLLLFGVA